MAALLTHRRRSPGSIPGAAQALVETVDIGNGGIILYHKIKSEYNTRIGIILG